MASRIFRVPSEICWLFRQVRPLLPFHLAAFFCVTGGTLCALANPLVLRWLIDVVLPGRRYGSLLYAAVLVFLSYAGRMALVTLGGYITLRVTQKMAVDLRARLLRHLDTLSADYHENTPVGASLYPLKEPIDEIAAFGSDLVPSLLRMLVAVAFTLGVMLKLNPRTTLAVLPLLPAFLMARIRYRRRIQSAADTVQQDRISWSNFVQEHISAIIPIQLLRRELRQERTAFLFLAKTARSQQRLYRTGILFTMSTSLTIAVAMAAVVGYGGWCVFAGTLTVGGLVAFCSYLVQLFEPLSGAVEIYTRAQKTFGSLRQVQAAFGHQPTIVNRPCAVPFPYTPAEIAVAGLRFAYARQATLSIPSLHISAGEQMAMMGANGAGKSTLAKLLVRLYDADSGSISIAGEDVRNIRLESLRRYVGYLPQNPVIFDGTVAANLRVVKPSASWGELEEVLECVALTNWLRHVPGGLDYWAGPGGSRLSGGQRQRLAIARALLAPPRILILDEATSCLDAPSEELVLENLRNRFPGSTLMVISHRPSTLSRFERVLVLAAGQIIRDGEFDPSHICPDVVAEPHCD